MTTTHSGNDKATEKRVDPVVDAYRQASAREDAGPKASVRAAVLAHARVVAAANATGAAAPLYDAPKVAAANDHSWMWRAAAGLVLGVLGVLMFQWMRPSGTAETSVASASIPAATAPVSPTVPSASPPAAPAQTAAPTANVAESATRAAAAVPGDNAAKDKLALASQGAADDARSRARASLEQRQAQIEQKVAAAEKAAEPRKPGSPTTTQGTVVASAAPAAPQPAFVAESTPSSPPALPAPMPPAASAPPPVAVAAGVAALPTRSEPVIASAPAAAAAAAPRADIAMRDEIAVAIAKRASAAESAAKPSRAYAEAQSSKPQWDKAEVARASGAATASVGSSVASADTARAKASFESKNNGANAAAAPMPPKSFAALDDLLFDAIRKNDATALRSAIARGANVNAKTPIGRSALQIARDDNRDELVEILIAAGAK